MIIRPGFVHPPFLTLCPHRRFFFASLRLRLAVVVVEHCVCISIWPSPLVFSSSSSSSLSTFEMPFLSLLLLLFSVFGGRRSCDVPFFGSVYTLCFLSCVSSSYFVSSTHPPTTSSTALPESSVVCRLCPASVMVVHVSWPCPTILCSASPNLLNDIITRPHDSSTTSMPVFFPPSSSCFLFLCFLTFVLFIL